MRREYKERFSSHHELAILISDPASWHMHDARAVMHADR